MSRTIRRGDRVFVNYTGRLADGTVFDSTKNIAPFEIRVGSGNAIEGFEEALLGLRRGDHKTVTIPVEKAYGPRHEDWVREVDREALPSDLQVREGMRLQVCADNQPPTEVTVLALNDRTATLDANHPLAGKTLTFDVEVVALES